MAVRLARVTAGGRSNQKPRGRRQRDRISSPALKDRSKCSWGQVIAEQKEEKKKNYSRLKKSLYFLRKPKKCRVADATDVKEQANKRNCDIRAEGDNVFRSESTTSFQSPQRPTTITRCNPPLGLSSPSKLLLPPSNFGNHFGGIRIMGFRSTKSVGRY